MDQISRVCVLAKPRRGHQQFPEWQMADVVVFIKAGDRDSALAGAKEALDHNGWEMLRLDNCDRLIETAVHQQGGEVWNLYVQAASQGSAIRVFPKHFAPGHDGIPGIRPPRITEPFIDVVVADVGGRRLTPDGATRLTDYQIDDWLLELKDLQEEGLLHPKRQAKLAELFRPYAASPGPMRIDPSILSEEDQRRFFDILSSPIQGQVKSASKQIRATKKRLSAKALRGGIIYLNTGYGSLPADEFGPLVDRYVRKDTSQIEAVLAISTWSMTNGFESWAFFEVHPASTQEPVVRRLQEAFGRRFEEAMTKLVTGQLDPSEQLSSPLTPISFNVDGLDFAWIPPEIDLPWNKDGHRRGAPPRQTPWEERR